MPTKTPLSAYIDELEAQVEAARVALKDADSAGMALVKEVDRLRAQIKTLLTCHYEQHEHRGSPSCFDLIEACQT